MGLFNWFGEPEHNVFDYKPRYYDPKKEELRQRFGRVDGSMEKEEYSPGSYIRGSLRNGRYQKSRTTANKAQNIIGIVGLILVLIVLMYMAKFFTIVDFQ